MHIIVLVKQVPDITRIPEEAWDREKGTLKRGLLDPVFNLLDLHALSLANNLKTTNYPDAQITCLTMGPRQAREILEDAISRGADNGILLTDAKFAGADTAATAYTIAQAIRKLTRDILKTDKYLVVSGMQSIDGDTAQVPAQIAEELNLDHIAYVRGLSSENGRLCFTRIGPHGLETIAVNRMPVVVTVANGFEPSARLFERAREAIASPGKITEWGAAAIEAVDERIGLKGSRTWVCKIFSAVPPRTKPCEYLSDVDQLLNQIKSGYGQARDGDPAPAEIYQRVSPGSYTGEVWVYIEISGASASEVSFELMTRARELAGTLGEKAAAVVPGAMTPELAAELFAAGAQKIYVCEDPALEVFRPVPYKSVLSRLVGEYRPQIFLFGATPMGRELAPRVAYAKASGLTADCTALVIGDHAFGHQTFVAALKQTRPALGGNIMAVIMAKDSRCQMATVRPGIFRPSFHHERSGEVIACPFDVTDTGAVEIIRISRGTAKPALSGADIVVSGGRGVGKKEDVDKYLRPLADALSQWLGGKAEVAGSRLAVEEGFVGQDRQVGQTGQTVAPKLYIALGISGAIQHITGMQRAGLIVAVNTDPQARIFYHSDLGVIAPIADIVPRMIERIRERLNEAH